MFSISLKDKRAIWVPLSLIVVFILIGTTVGNYFPWYIATRDKSTEQLNNLLSNYISVLGIGFAVLAILFAIIQLAYRQLSIIQILIESSYFLPVFYFGMGNVMICAILSSFQYQGTPFSDHLFSRLVVIEGYLFWLLIPAITLVFVATIQLTDFSLISEAYLKRIYRMAQQEKKGGTSNKFREQLQLYGQEVRSEMTTLIDQNKVIQFNRFFDFYIGVLKQNRNSNLLEGLHTNMKNWFVQSYKLPDKDAFRNIITLWWKYYKEWLETTSANQTNFWAAIPLDLYNDYRKTKDKDHLEIAIDIFPIRLKEFALMSVYQMLQDRKDYKQHYRKMTTNLFIFPDLIKSTIDEGDYKSLRAILSQLRMLLQFVESEKETLDNTKQVNATLHTPQDEELRLQLEKVISFLYSIWLNAYGWLIYKYYQDE